MDTNTPSDYADEYAAEKARSRAIIGQAVRLKSGGVEMTAGRVTNDGDILCLWFSGGGIQQQSIPLAALEVVEFSTSDGRQTVGITKKFSALDMIDAMIGPAP